MTLVNIYSKNSENAWTRFRHQGHQQVYNRYNNKGSVHDIPPGSKVRFRSVKHSRCDHLKTFEKSAILVFAALGCLIK